MRSLQALSPVLERLADEAGGPVLAKVDVDANQQLAAAFQVQSIPTVYVVWQGQVVPVFQGALPEAQVRQFVGRVAAGLTHAGAAGPRARARSSRRWTRGWRRPSSDRGGRLEAAVAAYQEVLACAPGDEEARRGWPRWSSSAAPPASTRRWRGGCGGAVRTTCRPSCSPPT